MLKEKVGYPWTTLPDQMFAHGAAGYGGHGTLCGSLGGSSCIINLVAYEPGKDVVYKQIIDRLFKQQIESISQYGASGSS